MIPYSYQYEVQDADTANFQNKAELKTETGDVYGSYSVLMPDGYIYTTTYNVTGTSGYVARLIKTLAGEPFDSSDEESLNGLTDSLSSPEERDSDEGIARA